uniref:Uncharacterized protein n=1 Tax=Escherichia coli TaxID=562 RepID=A0A3G4RX85_ECOLX|nr:hypothetical protein D0362_00145 [Escherichia coli]
MGCRGEALTQSRSDSGVTGSGLRPDTPKSVPLCATLSAEKIFKGDFVSY